MDCSAINYFATTKRCKLYDVSAQPHGPGNLMENNDALYAEQFCVSGITEDR